LEKIGASAISDLKALKLTFKGEFMQTALEVEETYSADEQKQVISVGGNAMMTSVISEASAYMKQGPNQMDLPKMIHDDMKKTLGVLPEMALLNSDEVSLEGIEDINGENAYTIKVPGTGVSYTYYYGVDSGLKLRESTMVNFGGQMQTNTTDFSEYTENSGLTVPGKKSFNMGGQDISLSLDSVEVNPE
jgi:zinc protease